MCVLFSLLRFFIVVVFSLRNAFRGLTKDTNSGPVVAMTWEELSVVKTGRMMLGDPFS